MKIGTLARTFGLFLCWGTVQAQGLQANEVVAVRLSPAKASVAAGGEVHVRLLARVEPGWHVNSKTPSEDFLIPSEVKVSGAGVRLVRAVYPKAVDVNLGFMEKPISVYEGDVVFELTLGLATSAKQGTLAVKVELDYQACNDKTCLPPTSVSTSLSLAVTPAVSSPPGAKARPEENGDSTIAPGQPPAIAATADSASGVQSSAREGELSMALALLFAFLGGMILNLMPCVLPVLSLKIMGMVKQAGETPRERLKQGGLFTLGVVVSFWVLAGLMILLQAGGEQLGWGFQLQSPSFVIVLSLFLFLFGLSMFGLFEIGTSLTGIGAGAGGTSAGSFLSGVLATTVATPCTAPFMGSALGFTLGQPAPVVVLIFTFVGLGMAVPYLLLTSIPALLRFVPKPGAWMESLKQFMGFLLMATVLWLLWVLSLQTGADGVVTLLAALLLAGVGGWVFGRWGNIARETRTRRIAQFVAVLFIAGGFWFALTRVTPAKAAAAGVHRQGSIDWVAYAPELVDGLRREGKPVFLDFTAAWCLSCQVNEKVAFGSEEVQKAFAEKGIVAVRADWTNRDSTITRALASFGRNSVPLYVYYAPGRDGVLLPEIITPGIVLEAIGRSLPTSP